MRPRGLLLPTFLCAWLLAGHARAAVVSVEPFKDNTLYESTAGELSNGSGNYLFTGISGVNRRLRTLLAFDVAGSIPAGSTINSVTLHLHMSMTIVGPKSTSLHRVLADWGEGASDAGGNEGGGAPSEPGDATWLHTFLPDRFWNSPGGDYVAASSATIVVDDFGDYAWSTAQMVADVQGWLDDASTNFGWILIGDETVLPTAKRFDSRAVPSAANRPRLEIDYTSPVAAGACCSGGSCSLETAADCAALGGVYQGDGTTCAAAQCELPTGACCAHDGTCSEETTSECARTGGTYQGDGTACAPDLCPVVLEPFVDSLPIIPVAQPASGTVGGEAYYEIAAEEFKAKLHRDLPPTTMWGYEGMVPGPTIEAAPGKPVTVKWINDLRDASGELRTDHYLPVDTCLHGPNHAGPTPRTVVHLHGAHVEAEYDGYPENTFLPGQYDVYRYSNFQLPATLWYHDHALGITRLNVYLGLAAFYIIRDEFENGLGLPAGEYEIPMVLLDRSFNSDGSLRYPAQWQDTYFGDTMVVNGKVWPVLQVKRGKYRFRLLNACNGRTLTLALSTGDVFHQIGTDGGLLPAPVPLTELTLGPAERADLVMDFSAYPAGTEIILTNSAPAPFPGTPGVGVIPEVMKFVVTDEPGDTRPLPQALRPVPPIAESSAVQHRDFLLRKMDDACTGSAWTINGLRWDDIVEYPELGTVEVWRFINPTGMMHPMHMHLVQFQILDRQPFEMVDGEIVPLGPPVPPPPNEAGWKDTTQVPPRHIVRVIARFERYTGKFAYHCHILEHEDQEMMRQFQTVQCGNDVVEPTEECDDGNVADVDGCSADCEIEDFLVLVGYAKGGTVGLRIDGVGVRVPTVAGQGAVEIVAALAAAINDNASLSAADVEAIAVDHTLRVDEPIDDILIEDPGLSEGLMMRVGSSDALWLSQTGADSVDIVRGDLRTLRESGGSFTAATLDCLTDDRSRGVYAMGLDPQPGEGFWYLAREVYRLTGSTYDSFGPAQVAPRDPGIAASGRACP